MRTPSDPSARLVERVTDAASHALRDPVTVDQSWRPPVQGAVGHVLGLVGADDGRPLVAKIFGPAMRDRAENEAAALRVAAPLGDRAPALHAAITLEDGTAVVVMSRLPGQRWADRRPGLSRAERVGVVERVGSLAADLHRIRGTGFGPIAEKVPVRGDATASSWTSELVVRTLVDFAHAGGDPVLGAGLERLAGDTTEVVADGDALPSFCHQDFNGGNLLLSGTTGTPAVSGVVDFERAEWADPMHDLALTVTHLMHEDEADLVPVLLDAHGGLTDGERLRLDLHVALRLAAEWAWIMVDRPANWRSKTASLGRWLEERVRPGGAG